MNKFFDLSLLHPRNWLTWLGLGVLWLLVQLPYPLLHMRLRQSQQRANHA